MVQDLPPDHDLSHLRSFYPYIQDFGIAIDCGAHKGIWTRDLLDHFNLVIAIEPVFDNFKHLPEEAQRFNLAVGEQEREVFIKAGKENTGQYHVSEEGVIARMVTIDSFQCDPGFIKLDVEGYELNALKGAKETIERAHPVIMIEENGLCERYGVHTGGTGQYLESLGYKPMKRVNKDYVYCYG